MGAFPGSIRRWAVACSRRSTRAIGRGLVRSCHDLSEGGLAVAIAEMALAGGLGARVALTDVAHEDDADVDLVILFSESPTRFLIEVSPRCLDEVVEVFRGLPLGRLGVVTAIAGDGNGDSPRLTVHGLDRQGGDRRGCGRLESRLAAAARLVVVRYATERLSNVNVCFVDRF